MKEDKGDVPRACSVSLRRSETSRMTWPSAVHPSAEPRCPSWRRALAIVRCSAVEIGKLKVC
jgi:hypothetical protein